MKITISLLCLLIICCLSCSKDNREDASEDLKYKYYNLENTGWKSRQSEHTIDDIIYSAAEVPLEYYILKENGDSNLLAIDSIAKSNNTERIIEFDFVHDEEKDLLDKEFTGMSYEETVKYMAFHLKRDFYVVTTTNDTILCSDVIYERRFKVAPNNKVILFFSNVSPKEDIQLVYKDNLYRKGTIKFKFKDKITKLDL